MLQDGVVVERGTHQELVALRGAYYTMFESQLHGALAERCLPASLLVESFVYGFALEADCRNKGVAA